MVNTACFAVLFRKCTNKMKNETICSIYNNAHCLDTPVGINDSSEKDAEDFFLSEYLRLRDNHNKKVLYIHTPFCRSKCTYCVCHSKVGSESEIEEYAKSVLAEQLLRFQDVLSQIAFDEVYFGGGTPSVISAEQWEYLFGLIPNFSSIKVKSMECSPSTITLEHIELLERYEFSYVSLGIQSMNQGICRKYNRTYVSKEKIAYLSKILHEHNLYFNFDLICYMQYGDIRDLPGFEVDLDFLMKQCKPSSIVCHQLYQTHFTLEKTRHLMKLLRKKIQEYPEYECINAELNDEDAYNDTVYQAEYRLICEERQFRHYMWNKYPTLPMVGYDVFAVGYMKNMSIKANVEDLLYLPVKHEIQRVQLNEMFDEDERRIRKNKMLEW